MSLDKMYEGPSGHETVKEHRYVDHNRPTGEDCREQGRAGRRKARRWVVERTWAWLSKCRALLVRYHKHHDNYLGSVQLTFGSLWNLRLYRLTAALMVLRCVLVESFAVSLGSITRRFSIFRFGVAIATVG